MKAGEPIRVLVVEDSTVARELIFHILATDPGVRVVGTARNGTQALAEAERLHPDVITMDINMPEMNGLEATRRIMEKFPLPIIIVSGTVNRRELSTTFEAIKAGAVAAIPRPSGPGSPDWNLSARELLRTVKAMAEVRVVRRWQREKFSAPARSAPPPVTARELPQVVAIGASTGGPEAIRALLAELPADFPFPILAVQHMAAGFLGGLAEWLGRSCQLPVRLAQAGEAIQGGRVYLAPDDRHLLLGRDRRLGLSDDPPEKGVRPAVGCLFRSIAAVCGRRSVAILLTGMGDDGVREMKGLREAGALTIAQNQASSIIYGMPGEAARTGAAIYQLSPPEIGRMLVEMAGGGTRDEGRGEF